MTPIPPRILLVDDDRATLQALSSMLRLQLPSAVVDEAPSAESALVRVCNTRYDAVVADYRMPGMDGRAFLAHVQQIHPTTCGILMSGELNGAGAAAGQAAGFAFLPKPLDRTRLLTALRHAIARQPRRLSG